MSITAEGAPITAPNMPSRAVLWPCLHLPRCQGFCSLSSYRNSCCALLMHLKIAWEEAE